MGVILCGNEGFTPVSIFGPGMCQSLGVADQNLLGTEKQHGMVLKPYFPDSRCGK